MHSSNCHASVTSTPTSWNHADNQRERAEEAEKISRRVVQNCHVVRTVAESLRNVLLREKVEYVADGNGDPHRPQASLEL